MVPEAGVEPARCRHHGILSPVSQSEVGSLWHRSGEPGAVEKEPKKKDILTIPDFLDTEEQQVEMIRFLKKHPAATEEEVFQAVADLITAFL